MNWHTSWHGNATKHINLDRVLYATVYERKRSNPQGVPYTEEEITFVFDSQGGERSSLTLPWSEDEDRMLQEAGAVVSAAPGWELLNAWGVGDASDDHVIMRQPIIAWRVEARGDCLPIVIESSDTRATHWAILRPDGRVVIPADREYDSLEAWTKAINEIHEKAVADAQSAPVPDKVR